MEKYLVVSDLFKAVSADNILTYSQLMSRSFDEKKTTDIYLEQGLSEHQVEKIKQSFSQKNITIKSYFDECSRCSLSLTHKHKQQNVLISDPIQIQENSCYSSLLMIDECCAELSDHVTGKHIQFMVLVEAARQMVNAVTEKFYSNSAMIYLANNLDIKFNNFVYPFKTKLVYRIDEIKMKAAGNGKMKAVIEFIQAEELKSEVIFDFTILNRDFVTSIEDKSLAQAAKF